MQWLTLVPESSGVRRPETDRRRVSLTPPVEAPAPIKPAPADRNAPHHREPGQPPAERRNGGDRRQRQYPVLLDTRSRDDRRQPTAASSRQPATRRRINLHA